MQGQKQADRLSEQAPCHRMAGENGASFVGFLQNARAVCLTCRSLTCTGERRLPNNSDGFNEDRLG